MTNQKASANRRSILAAASAILVTGSTEIASADPKAPIQAESPLKISTTAELLTTIARSTPLDDGTIVETSGREAPGDGGGARFRLDAGNASADNGGTVRIDKAGRHWIAIDDNVSVRVFGAVGDGTTDDSGAFAAALAASPTIYVPPGRFFLAHPVLLNQGNQLVGDGSMRSMNGPKDQRCAILMPATAALVAAEPLKQLEDVTIRGLGFEGGTTQVDLGLFHDVTIEDCEFRGFSVAGLCIVRGEKQKLSHLRFDFTVYAKYGLCFGYEASVNYQNGLYAGQEPRVFFGSPDAWVDRMLMQQIYFQATPGVGTWTVAAISSRVLSGTVANEILFHGSSERDGKLISNLVRIQYSTFNTVLVDSINKQGEATSGLDTPEVLDCVFITMLPSFAGNSHFTRAFNFGATFGLTMIGCGAVGDNISSFGMYFANGVGQTIVLVGCSGAIYSAGAAVIASQITLIGCNFAVSNLPTHSGQQVDLRNGGFLSTIFADYNGKTPATAAAMWKFARGGGNLGTPFRIDANGAHLGAPLHLDTVTGAAAPLIILQNSGTPNGVVTANPGSLCLSYKGRSDGMLYVKQSGTGNTGWVAK